MPTAAAYASIGERLNHLTRCALAPVASPVADVTYPVSYLSDGRPGIPFRFGSVTSPSQVTQDLNGVVGGDMETWPLPTVATLGAVVMQTTGTVTQSATADGAGSAAQLATGATVRVDYICRPGEKIALRPRVRQVTGGVGTVTVTAQCVQTGNYWTGSAWTATPTAYYSASPAAYATATADPVMESILVAMEPSLILRVTVTSVTAASLLDNFVLYPWTDFAAVFGTKYVDPLHVITFRSSDDAAFALTDVLQATMVLSKPSFWAKVTPFAAQFLRLRIVGTPRAAPMIGELVFTQVHNFAASSRMPVNPHAENWTVEEIRGQGRLEGSGGNVFVTKQAAADRTDQEIPWKFLREADFQTWRAELRTRSEGGVYPIVIVPNSGQARVLFGMMDDRLKFQWIASSTDGVSGMYRSIVRVSELAPMDSAL